MEIEFDIHLGPSSAPMISINNGNIWQWIATIVTIIFVSFAYDLAKSVLNEYLSRRGY